MAFILGENQVRLLVAIQPQISAPDLVVDPNDPADKLHVPFIKIWDATAMAWVDYTDTANDVVLFNMLLHQWATNAASDDSAGFHYGTLHYLPALVPTGTTLTDYLAGPALTTLLNTASAALDDGVEMLLENVSIFKDPAINFTYDDLLKISYNVYRKTEFDFVRVVADFDIPQHFKTQYLEWNAFEPPVDVSGLPDVVNFFIDNGVNKGSDITPINHDRFVRPNNTVDTVGLGHFNEHSGDVAAFYIALGNKNLRATGEITASLDTAPLATCSVFYADLQHSPDHILTDDDATKAKWEPIVNKTMPYPDYGSANSSESYTGVYHIEKFIASHFENTKIFKFMIESELYDYMEVMRNSYSELYNRALNSLQAVDITLPIGLAGAFWFGEPLTKQEQSIIESIIGVPLIFSNIKYENSLDVAYQRKLVSSFTPFLNKKTLQPNPFLGIAQVNALAFNNDVSIEGEGIFGHSAASNKVGWFNEDAIITAINDIQILDTRTFEIQSRFPNPNSATQMDLPFVYVARRDLPFEFPVIFIDFSSIFNDILVVQFPILENPQSNNQTFLDASTVDSSLINIEYSYVFDLIKDGATARMDLSYRTNFGSSVKTLLHSQVIPIDMAGANAEHDLMFILSKRGYALEKYTFLSY